MHLLLHFGIREISLTDLQQKDEAKLLGLICVSGLLVRLAVRGVPLV